MNIQKARAARRRAPLPWRSGLESRIIEQLVWQWWKSNEPRKWAKYKVARFLGVSHTWVNKLVKRFEADPERRRRRMAAFAPTSFEKLERAREETQRQRERGWLRGPIRLRRVKVMLWGKKRAVTLPTRAETKRRALLRQSCGGQAGPLHVRYQELPMWARGLLLPGDPGTATGRRSEGRAVPFAFRRRQ